MIWLHSDYILTTRQEKRQKWQQTKDKKRQQKRQVRQISQKKQKRIRREGGGARKGITRPRPKMIVVVRCYNHFRWSCLGLIPKIYIFFTPSLRTGWCFQIGWFFGKNPNGLPPSPHFRKIILQFFYNGNGCIYEGQIIWNACTWFLEIGSILRGGEWGSTAVNMWSTFWTVPGSRASRRSSSRKVEWWKKQDHQRSRAPSEEGTSEPPCFRVCPRPLEVWPYTCWFKHFQSRIGFC